MTANNSPIQFEINIVKFDIANTQLAKMEFGLVNVDVHYLYYIHTNMQYNIMYIESLYTNSKIN